MSFPQFWKQHGKNEEISEIKDGQLDLLNPAADLVPQRDRVTGVTIRDRFTKAIQDNHGDAECQARATDLTHRILFDLKTADLYRLLNAKRGDRSTLPEVVQMAILMAESASSFELERWVGGIPFDQQQELNQFILGIVSEQSRSVRQRHLPW